MNGPTREYICNKDGRVCDALNAWYNGGSHCYAKCEDGEWQGIKQFRPGGGCETPETCKRLKPAEPWTLEDTYHGRRVIWN